MTVENEKDITARKRITQVFRYLEELNRRRNPVVQLISEQPWALRLADLPINAAIEIGHVLPGDEEKSSQTESSDKRDFILRIGRSEITEAPKPIDELREWLRPGWDDPYKQVQIVPSRNQTIDGETVVILFETYTNLTQFFVEWKKQRDVWAANEIPARAARKLFEDIYAIYGRIEREGERLELILGDGMLHWRRSDGIIRHPILLQRVQLRFDPQKPEFIIGRAEQPLELYSALFRGMSDVDGQVIGKCRSELEQLQFDLLDDNIATGFLRRFVAQLSPRGEMVDLSAQKATGDDPHIARDPFIFLRGRTLGYATALEAIIGDLKQESSLPPSLLNVVGIEAQSEDTLNHSSISVSNFAVEDGKILLSKPANQEQIEIAQRLDTHGCVLVQGPPGTGKTHTIANLIGHLLAQGKSILVTSHTTKALRVLRQQVVPQLQPLCVSVLDGGEESRQQLEHSVATIVERLASSNVDTLTRRAGNLNDERDLLREKQQKLKEQLQRALFDEYRDVVVAGRSFSPSDAARKISQERANNSWIPSPINADSPLPLTIGELLDLYRTNVSLTPEDENAILDVLPQVEKIITPSDFTHLFEEHRYLEKKDLLLSVELWQLRQPELSPDTIEALLQQATKAVTVMNYGAEWHSAAIEAGREGGPQRKTWESLISLIEETETESAVAQEVLMKYGPVLTNSIPLEEQILLLSEIMGHLESGKQLSWLVMLSHADWKKIISSLSVNNQSPATLEHFKALKIVANLELRRQQLRDWWRRQMVPNGAPSIDDPSMPPELACRQYKPMISSALDWYTAIWLPIEKEFHRIGFDWYGLLQQVPVNFSKYGELLRLRDCVLQNLPPVFQSRIFYRRSRVVTEKMQAVVRYLDNYKEDGISTIGMQLRDALVDWDVDAFQNTYQRLVELNRLKSDLTVRRQLLNRLEISAPLWAGMIRDRQEPHHQQQLPGDAEHAWLWRQLNDELDRRNETSLDNIQQSLFATGTRLQETTAELVDQLAWASQVRRTSLTQRQALMGWLGTIKKIGKGTGVRVPRLRAEASKLMSDAQSSVPVWIMPLTRVVESFNPAKTRFDVVIIDEASQCDVMGLIAFYMGKQVVVVGDDEQVSPDAVGEKLDEVQNLIDQHLEGIPNAILYDGQQSVYDLANRSFGGTICLREHFRCVSDIIQFSNRLCYNGKIKPLRDESTVTTLPYVIEYRVEGAISNNKVNTQEAIVIASLVIAAIEQPEYHDYTFGIVSLVGEEQARYIETLLLKNLSPVEYEKRRIMCGTPPQFQGDERHVMFLSVVDGPQGGPLAMRQQSLFKKRFNVAASRARNQMWVVHSLNPYIDLKDGDLRRQLIEYAKDPQAFDELLHEKEAQTDSDFERQVLQRLMYAGYRVIPQWKVGYFRIDLVVEGNGKRLAIECDGDRFHTMENLAADMQRQSILERLGWTFVRIRGSEFYRHPDAAMIPVFERLSYMEILPQLSDESVTNQATISNDLYNRVVLRATTLRREWSGEDNVQSEDLFELELT